METNIIFWISIQNWVDFDETQIFSWILFFVEKFTWGPPQGLAKNEFLQKVVLGLIIKFEGYKMIVELKIANY